MTAEQTETCPDAFRPTNLSEASNPTAPSSTHLPQNLLPVLPPQNHGDDGQQQEDDAHQAANQNRSVAAVVFGHGKSGSRGHSSKV